MAHVTLLTDLGLQDASAGMVKGVLYTAMPGIRITDITHEVAPFSIAQGAYILGSAWSSFAAGTIHIVLVDVFSQAGPRMVLVAHKGHYFLAPDNGLLPMALGSADVEALLVHESTGSDQYHEWLRAIAGIVPRLGHKALQELDLPPARPAALPRAVQAQGPVTRCSILFIDHFGNIVTDMTRDRFRSLGGDAGFRIVVGAEVMTRLSANYTDVVKGDPLCRFNRRGYLEICVNKGDASALLGFKVGGIHNDIKIVFG